jgi:hypothetical protein
VLVLPATVAENCCCPLVETCAVDGATVTETEVDDWITIEAEADFVESATEVAVTVARAGLGIVAGAVYSPADVMEPQEPATQPIPDTAQVTPVFELPVTLAVNCCWPFTERVTLAGDRETATLVDEPMVTLAIPTSEGSERETALTMTIDGLGAVEGAI